MSVRIHRHTINTCQHVDGIEVFIDQMRSSAVQVQGPNNEIISEECPGNRDLPCEQLRVNTCDFQCPGSIP